MASKETLLFQGSFITPQDVRDLETIFYAPRPRPLWEIPKPNKYSRPDIEFFPGERYILIGERKVALSSVESKLLCIFTNSPNILIKVEELIGQLLKGNEPVKESRADFNRDMERLRHKLEPDARRGEFSIIVRVGYKSFKMVGPSKTQKT